MPSYPTLSCIRNPLDTSSLGVLRKSDAFDATRGYVWSVGNAWLDNCLQHMKFCWLFPVAPPRYEDALEDPHLAMRAILRFLWRAHRPEERLSSKPFNASLLDVALRKLSCRNIDNFKCLTGGLANVGKHAACFSPTLDLMGYDIRPSAEGAMGRTARATALCASSSRAIDRTRAAPTAA